MTIKEFIEAAIEGGYNPGWAMIIGDLNKESILKSLNHMDEYYLNYYESIEHFPSVFLDPEAWKAVGKVKGWKVGEYPYDNNFIDNHRTGFVAPYEGVDWYGVYWQYAIHLIVDEPIKGKTLEEYISTL